MNSVLKLNIDNKDKLLILKRQISIVEEKIEEEEEIKRKLEEGCPIVLFEKLINDIDNILQDEGAINNRDHYIKEYIKREYGGTSTEEGLKYYKEKRRWIKMPNLSNMGCHVKDGKITYKEFYNNQEYIGMDIYGHPLEKPYELYYKLNPLLKYILKAIKKMESQNKIYDFKLERHNTIIENLLTNVGSLNRKVEFLKNALDNVSK